MRCKSASAGRETGDPVKNIIRILREMIEMSKKLQAWRYVLLVVSGLAAIVLWRLPEVINGGG